MGRTSSGRPRAQIISGKIDVSDQIIPGINHTDRVNGRLAVGPAEQHARDGNRIAIRNPISVLEVAVRPAGKRVGVVGESLADRGLRQALGSAFGNRGRIPAPDITAEQIKPEIDGEAVRALDVSIE